MNLLSVVDAEERWWNSGNYNCSLKTTQQGNYSPDPRPLESHWDHLAMINTEAEIHKGGLTNKES